MIYASGTWTLTRRARKNDSIDATQNASTHHTNEKETQKRSGNEKTRPTKKKTLKTWVALEMKSEDGQSSNTHNDQDSDISFENDTDDDIDTTVLEEEEWINYIRRSTDEAMEKMENAKIRFWKKTHKRMTWRLALRIASQPSERWLVKAAEWNSELSSRCKTNRAIGKPRRRWADDINEFLKLAEDETENFFESDNKYNKSWINAAEDRGRWTLLENDHTMQKKDLKVFARHSRNTQRRPARYVIGVRLSGDEVANIT